MRRRFPFQAAVVLAGGLSAVVALHAQGWPRESPPPPLPARHFDVPPFQLKSLPNGLQVLYVPQHEEPSVSYRLLVRAGAVQEPPDRPGVANFTASLLNTGTTTKSALQIATLVESAGGIMDVSSDNELTYVSGAVVKDRVDVALGVASDMVQHPAFAPQEIDLQKRQSLSALEVAYDDPAYLAQLVFDRLVFGLHPYGRPTDGTADSIGRITQADLVAFHHTWFVPNNALLAIVGDLSADEAFAAAARAFGDWERRPVPEVKVVTPPPPARHVVVIDRPGSAQTEIRVGHLGIARRNPDYIPFDLAIRILGGEGANRLFNVLRSDRGLTYGASADLRTFQTSGEVVAQTNTRSAATVETLKLMVGEFDRLQRERVSDAELQGAQDFISGHFPLSLETSSDIAGQVLSRLFYGLDPSDIETYLDQVQRVTPADIQRVTKTLLHPDALTIVLVGDASAFRADLKAAGFAPFDEIPLADLDADMLSLRRSPAVTASGK